MIELNHRFKRSEDLVTRRIAGETILVTVRSNVADLDSVYTLDEVGSRIWELLDGRHSLGQIAEAIEREYQVERDQARGDVAEFIAALRQAGLVQAGDGRG